MFPITLSLKNLVTAVQEEGLTDVTWEATSLEEVQDMLYNEMDLSKGVHFIVHKQAGTYQTYDILGFYNNLTFHFSVLIK